MTENPEFGGFGGPIYWDFREKMTEIPDTSPSFFDDFLVRYIRGIGPDIRENS